MTGQICTDLVGVGCDYPNTNPSFHMACLCMASGDAGPGPTWTCFQSMPCPATQPAYSLTETCSGPAVCSYSTPPYHCACVANGPGGHWTCF